VATTTWRESYSLGHLGIDEDHRRFFDLLESLDADLKAAKALSAPAINALVEILDHHVDGHFHREEELMADLKAMPEAVREAHRRDHDRWRLRIRQHLEPLRGASTDLIRRAHLARILYESRSFWEEHFLLHDVEISRYLDPGKAKRPAEPGVS